MKRAILEDRTPNLYVLHYDLTGWLVRTVILVPHFAFALSAVERRPPLAATARRAGWVGCNIMLDKVSAHARGGKGRNSKLEKGKGKSTDEIGNRKGKIEKEKPKFEKRNSKIENGKLKMGSLDLVEFVGGGDYRLV